VINRKNTNYLPFFRLDKGKLPRLYDPCYGSDICVVANHEFSLLFKIKGSMLDPSSDNLAKAPFLWLSEQFVFLQVFDNHCA
jgi:hypothetical protein